MALKIALINPRKGWRPPLGLLYVASSLVLAGNQVKVFEFADEDYFPGANENLWRELFSFDPEVIGLGVISWNRKVALGMIERILRTHSGKRIVCGGKDPTFKPSIYLRAGADFVVMHEGEETFVELVSALEAGASYQPIKGVAFLDGDALVETEARPPLNLTHLPFPAFHLVDYHQYSNIRLGGIPGHFIKTGFMMANRGCPYRCRFCTDPVRHIYRERDIEDIIAELKWQKQNWRIEGMVFLDDLFFLNENRVIALCKRILEEKIELKLYAQARVDTLGSAETLALMKRAGFIQLALGVESGSQKMLDVMKKGTNLEQIRTAIRLIEEAGIITYAFLIIGFPEETEEDLRLTADFLREVKPTFVTVNYFMPMPGTEYYESLEVTDTEGLSYSLTEDQQNFPSQVPAEKLHAYRSQFLRLAKKSANRHLFGYPSFYLWLLYLVFLRPHILIRGVYQQWSQKRYTGYFEAVRTAMINDRIFR